MRDTVDYELRLLPMENQISIANSCKLLVGSVGGKLFEFSDFVA